jgi:hypothetical protein
MNSVLTAMVTGLQTALVAEPLVRVHDGPRAYLDLPDDNMMIGQPLPDLDVTTNLLAEGLSPRYRETITIPVMITSKGGDDLAARRDRVQVMLGHLAGVVDGLRALGADPVLGPDCTFAQDIQQGRGAMVVMTLVVTVVIV